MQTVLAAVAAGAAVLGLIFANLFPEAVPRRTRWRVLTAGELRPALVLAAVSAVVLFLLTLPSTKPFSPGLTLGWGILIGAVLGLYALFEASGSVAGQSGGVRTAGLLSAAALGPAAILLIFRGYPNQALMGCAIGAVLVAAICSCLARPLFAAAPEEERDRLACFAGVELFALATVAVSAACGLAIDHFPRMARGDSFGGYWAFPPLALAAAALATAVVSGAGKAEGKWMAALRRMAGGGIVVLLTLALQLKLLPALRWELALYGFATLAFIIGTVGEAGGAERTSRPVAATFGAVLLTLAAVAIAFKRLHGYGEGLALLAALPVAVAACLAEGRVRDSVTSAVATGAVSVLLLLTLNRLFLERGFSSWTLDFQQHYDYLAVVFGIGACFALMAFTARGVEGARTAGRSAAASIPRTIFLGIAIAVVPLALAALWGAKAINAFLVGLVFAQVTWMLLAAWTAGEERQTVLAGAPQVFMVAATLIAIQLAPRVLELELARGYKLIIAGVITLVAIIWVVADAWRRPPRGGDEANEAAR